MKFYNDEIYFYTVQSETHRIVGKLHVSRIDSGGPFVFGHQLMKFLVRSRHRQLEIHVLHSSEKR